MLPEGRDGGLLIVGRLERDEPPIHQLRYLVGGIGQQELANANVIDQDALAVDDVNHVQRLAVLSVRAHVVEHLLDAPVLADRHVIRRH